MLNILKILNYIYFFIYYVTFYIKVMLVLFIKSQILFSKTFSENIILLKKLCFIFYFIFYKKMGSIVDLDILIFGQIYEVRISKLT